MSSTSPETSICTGSARWNGKYVLSYVNIYGYIAELSRDHQMKAEVISEAMPLSSSWFINRKVSIPSGLRKSSFLKSIFVYEVTAN